METDMWYQTAADLLLVFHLLFILFVVAGGLLAIKWRWIAWLHLPAVCWGALVEINSWVCVLTPWENQLRHLAGQDGYTGGFIEYYIASIIYPDGLTAGIQVAMGISVIVINVFMYSYIVYRSGKK